MPTKRRYRTRRRTGLTLGDMGIDGQLGFLVGVQCPSDPEDERPSRWQTYADYLREYRVVRDDFLVRRGEAAVDTSFVEALLRRVDANPGADVEAIGGELLETFDPVTTEA